MRRLTFIRKGENMRRFLLLGILFSSIILPCFAQSGYITEYFTIGNNYTNHVDSRAINLCSEGSVVILGNYIYMEYEEPCAYRGNIISKFNSNGDYVWMYEFYGFNTNRFRNISHIDSDDDDNVYFFTIENFFEYQDIIYWKIDVNGNITQLNDDILAPYALIKFTKSIRLPNNEIISVGMSNTNPNPFYSDSQACFFRFSPNGDTLNSVHFSSDQNYNFPHTFATNIVQKTNGNFLMSCQLTENVGTLLELDINGTIINRYDLTDSLMYYRYSSIPVIEKIPNSNDFIIAYIAKYTNEWYQNGEFRVAKLSDEGIESLFNIEETPLIMIESIQLTTDAIYMCGFSNNTRGTLIKMSFDGEILWEKQIYGTNSHFGSSECNYLLALSSNLLDIGNDGSIYMAWSNSQSIIAMKLLPNGQLANEQEIIPVNDNYISVYPNPGIDKLISLSKGTNYQIKRNK